MRWMIQNKLKGVTSMTDKFSLLPIETKIFLNEILGIKEVSLQEILGIHNIFD